MADTTTRVFSAKKDGQALFFPGLVPSRYSIISEYIANDPYARHRFTELSEILGYSLVEAYREADIYDWEVYELGHSAVCLALADFAVEKLGVEPTVVVGQSFGSFVGALFSGVLSTEDMVRLVQESTRVELDYFENLPQEVGCLFFYRMTSKDVHDLVHEGAVQSEDSWLEVSIDLDTTVHAVSGTVPELERFRQRVKEKGGFPFYMMNRAEHCSRVSGLRDRLDHEVYEHLNWREASVPMLSDVDGKLRWDGTEIRKDLLDGWTTPVVGSTITEGLLSANVGTTHVMGPRNLFSRMTDKYVTTSVVSPRKVMQFHSQNTLERDRVGRAR